MIDTEVLGSLTPDDLEQVMSKAVMGQAGLAAEVVSLVQEADRRELWRADGCVRLSDWVAQRLGLSGRDAARLTRTARALVALDEVHRALSDGVISWPKAMALVDICEGPSEQAFWVAAAAESTADHLDAVARRRRKERRDRDVEESLGVGSRNSLRMVPDPDNASLRFWGRLVGDDAARFQTYIESVAKNEMAAAAGEEMDRWDLRCGDALAAVTSAALGGLSRDRATLAVHIDQPALESAGAEGEASMKPPQDYPVIQSVLERLMCDCRWQAVIHGEDGSVLRFTDVAHPPPAVEQAVVRRDSHCVIKGCRATHGEVHHVIWRSRGGKTIIANLVFVCWRHHRMIHHHGWSLTGDADHLTWARPDGTVVWTTGHPKLAA